MLVDLDTVLKDGHWEAGGGDAGHPQPEIGVGRLLVEGLAGGLQPGQPGGQEVAVLEDHPGARLGWVV